MMRAGASWASIIPALDLFPNRRSLAASFTGFARVGWLYYKCSLSFPCLSPVLTAVHPRSPSFRARTPCSLATPASRHAHRHHPGAHSTHPLQLTMSALQKISDLEKGIRGSVAKAKGLTEILSYVASKEVSYQGWRAG